MIDGSWRPVREFGMLTRCSADGVLLESRSDAHEVNEAGAFIWSKIGGRHTVDEIIDMAAARYSTDRTVAAGVVHDFLTDLVEKGFIVPAAP